MIEVDYRSKKQEPRFEQLALHFLYSDFLSPGSDLRLKAINLEAE